MQSTTVANDDSIKYLPIGPKLYPVRMITQDTHWQVAKQRAVLAKSGGKPLHRDIADAYAALARAMIDGDHPELTDEYVHSWLSPALGNMIAFEYQRQFVGLMDANGGGLPKA